MSDYQNNQDSVTNTIAKIKAMLAEVPDRVRRELTCPGKCTDYKPSKHFAHTLECSKCGDTVEDTISDRILSQHAEQRNDKTNSNPDF